MESRWVMLTDNRVQETREKCIESRNGRGKIKKLGGKEKKKRKNFPNRAAALVAILAPGCED